MAVADFIAGVVALAVTPDSMIESLDKKSYTLGHAGGNLLAGGLDSLQDLGQKKPSSSNNQQSKNNPGI